MVNKKTEVVLQACKILEAVFSEFKDKKDGEITVDAVNKAMEKNRESFKESPEEVLAAVEKMISSISPKKKPDTLYFSLLVDEQRSKILHSLQMAVLGNPEAMKFIAKEGLLESFLELYEELGDREHEFGWCPDENCTAGNEDV